VELHAGEGDAANAACRPSPRQDRAWNVALSDRARAAGKWPAHARRRRVPRSAMAGTPRYGVARERIRW